MRFETVRTDVWRVAFVLIEGHPKAFFGISELMCGHPPSFHGVAGFRSNAPDQSL